MSDPTEIIAPGAFKDLPKTVPLRWGNGGPIIGTAAVKAAQDIDDAMYRTVTLAASFHIPAFTEDVLTEVKHRAKRMSATAAWESVGDDLRAGRWKP